MEAHINIGAVWARKTDKSSTVCIVGVNRQYKLVFVAGLPDSVEPSISFEYFMDTWQPQAGWNTVA